MLALRLRNRELLRAAAYLVVTAGVLGAVHLVERLRGAARAPIIASKYSQRRIAALPKYPAPGKTFPVPQWVGACLFALITALPLGAEEMSRVPVARAESLELPGLTAGCHICEWRPKLNQMPALQECGADASGGARIGVFECGFSQDCQRECHFLRCETH